MVIAALGLSATLPAIPAGHASAPSARPGRRARRPRSSYARRARGRTRCRRRPSTIAATSSGSPTAPSPAARRRSEPVAERPRAQRRRPGRPPGYVASEAYGINERRVVPACCTTRRSARSRSAGRRAAGPCSRVPTGGGIPSTCQTRRAQRARRDAATMLITGQRVAVRWSADGVATALPPPPGTRGRTSGASTTTGWSQAGRAESRTRMVRTTRCCGTRRRGGRPADGARHGRRRGVRDERRGPHGRLPRQPRHRWRAGRAEHRPGAGSRRGLGVAERRPARAGASGPPGDYAALVDVNDRGQAAGWRAGSRARGSRSSGR